MSDTHIQIKQKSSSLADKVAKVETLQNQIKDLLQKYRERDNTAWIETKLESIRQEIRVHERAISRQSSPFTNY